MAIAIRWIGSYRRRDRLLFRRKVVHRLSFLAPLPSLRLYLLGKLTPPLCHVEQRSLIVRILGVLRNADQVGCILPVLFNASHIQSPDAFKSPDATARFQSIKSTP